MSKQLFVVKPGTISSKDKEKMSKNGFLVIEHPNPDEVRLVVPEQEINPSTLLMAALKGACYSNGSKDEFATELFKRLQEKEQKKSIINE